jgi:hypothetical protein
MRPKGRRTPCAWRQRTQPLLRRLVACPSPTLEAVNLRHVGNVRYSSHEPPGYWPTWRVSVDNVARLGRRKRAILTRREDERRLTRHRRRRNLRNERELRAGPEPLLAAVEAPTSSNHDFWPLRFGAEDER